jgi:hypothetical protein
MKSTTERYLDITTRNIDESPLLLIAKTAVPTLIFDILHFLKASTLLQATAILKALITESLGRGRQLGLSIITFTDLLLIRLIPTLLLYRHLNRPGKHIPLKVRIH